MDPAALRAEIETGPLAAELAPLVAAGRDADAAAALNRQDFPGPVPLREVSAYCVTRGITGVVLALDDVPLGAEIAPGVPMTLQIKGLVKTARTLIQDDYRLEEADLASPLTATLLGGLVTLGVMTAGQQAELLALGGGRRSRAEIAFGSAVSAADVGAAFAGVPRGGL